MGTQSNQINQCNPLFFHQASKYWNYKPAIDTIKMHIVWNTLRKSWTNLSKHANLILNGDGEKEVFRPLGG